MSPPPNSDQRQTLQTRMDDMQQQMNLIVRSSLASGPGTPLDLYRLWLIVWRGKWAILASAVIVGLLTMMYTLSLANMYRSSTLVAPIEEGSANGLMGLAGQFGGLANLAGFNLQGSDKAALALEVLKSREFISKFIDKHHLLLPLFAAKGWDRDRDQLILDNEIYDTDRATWVRNVAPPRQAKPSLQEAYEKFTRKLHIRQDKSTKFVTVALEFYSPKLAKQWLTQLIVDINEEMKRRDVEEANKSIEYLSTQLEKTSVAGMKTVFYELIEEQTKTVMFAEVRTQYVFKTIDPAIEPELKSRPKRAIISLFGIFVGGIFGFAFVVVRALLKP